jgi:membrane-bound ClpP family serine protease
MRGNGVVAHTEITATAGAAAQAWTAGAVVGATGRLMTDAMPTGRARFATGDLDVTVLGQPGQRGDLVAILAIDGPSITVRLAPPAQGSHNVTPP